MTLFYDAKESHYEEMREVKCCGTCANYQTGITPEGDCFCDRPYGYCSVRTCDPYAYSYAYSMENPLHVEPWFVCDMHVSDRTSEYSDDELMWRS